MLPIIIALASISLVLLSGILPMVFFKRGFLSIKSVHAYLLSLSGIGLVASGLFSILHHLSLTMKMSFGFPVLIYSIHFDPLSEFFLCLIGLIIFIIALYTPSYLKYYENTRDSIRSLLFFTSVFITSMCFVVLANDIFSFMLAWELMSLSSYFLVIYHHEDSENRHAGLIYLIMAHLSGLLILSAFSVLAKFSGSFDFQLMQNAALTNAWASIAFILAFIGFGVKAGLIPTHAWLPKAHPAAPSHISALMSGVMLKIAAYGFIRFTFTLLKQLHWQWGVLVLLIGCLSAVFGILFALMQSDLKKLLAYSSIENMGCVFIALGLSIIFISQGFWLLGALGFIAALYHCLNHAVFKSLLFLGAGAVIQHTHKQDLEHLGGLIHKMPQTAFFFLIGCISISALPPFNGFVSEWLIFQTSLQSTMLHGTILRTIIPLAAAALALTGALALACFTKVYGIAFLGKPRTRRAKQAKKPGKGMRFSMGISALLCLAFGVMPVFILKILNQIALSLFQAGLPNENFSHWLWMIPISKNVSSYNPLFIFAGIMAVGIITYFILKKRSYSVSLKELPAWDCGFGGLNSRMQYSAKAFSMPIRRVFYKVFNIEEIITTNKNIDPLITTNKLKYELRIQDWIWIFCYQPLALWTQKTARGLSKLQGGNIRVYLAYMFFTLLFLLWVVS